MAAETKSKLLELENEIKGSFWDGDYQALESLKGKTKKQFKGSDLYAELEVLMRELPETYGDMSQAASEYLNSLGIPGIKYFDGSSRAAGEGTRNFVVFDDKIPQVLRRNGEKVSTPEKLSQFKDKP